GARGASLQFLDPADSQTGKLGQPLLREARRLTVLAQQAAKVGIRWRGHAAIRQAITAIPPPCTDRPACLDARQEYGSRGLSVSSVERRTNACRAACISSAFESWLASLVLASISSAAHCS